MGSAARLNAALGIIGASPAELDDGSSRARSGSRELRTPAAAPTAM
jgi:hypothetical protein